MTNVNKQQLYTVVPGILSREVIKFFFFKELDHIKLSTQKHEVLQFFPTSFQILNCYMIVYYDRVSIANEGSYKPMTILFC